MKTSILSIITLSIYINSLESEFADAFTYTGEKRFSLNVQPGIFTFKPTLSSLPQKITTVKLAQISNSKFSCLFFYRDWILIGMRVINPETRVDVLSFLEKARTESHEVKYIVLEKAMEGLLLFSKEEKKLRLSLIIDIFAGKVYCQQNGMPLSTIRFKSNEDHVKFIYYVGLTQNVVFVSEEEKSQIETFLNENDIYSSLVERNGRKSLNIN
jgi:hypothetical protein